MQTMQTKILKTISNIVSGYGLEAVQVADYGNCGTVYVQPEDDVNSLGEIGYNFQSGTMKFTLTFGGVKIPSQPGRDDYFDFYMDYSDTPAWRTFQSAMKNAVAVAEARAANQI